MKIETKLKEYILTRYKTMREFTQAIDIPYTTMDSILRRGIGNSSIANVLKICEALGISADELANGRITPANIGNRKGSTEIIDILNETKSKLLTYDNLTLNGEPIDDTILNSLLVSLDTVLEITKRITKSNKI